jgi:hypothetical protein
VPRSGRRFQCVVAATEDRRRPRGDGAGRRVFVLRRSARCRRLSAEAARGRRPGRGVREAPKLLLRGGGLSTTMHAALGALSRAQGVLGRGRAAGDGAPARADEEVGHEAVGAARDQPANAGALAPVVVDDGCAESVLDEPSRPLPAQPRRGGDAGVTPVAAVGEGRVGGGRAPTVARADVDLAASGSERIVRVDDDPQRMRLLRWARSA